MSGIFISYRRSDSAPHAGRLYDRLCDYFGADKVFMDVDDIKPGADFVSLIGEKVASCDALIAVIGKGWLARDEDNGKPRMYDPTTSSDWNWSMRYSATFCLFLLWWRAQRCLAGRISRLR